MTTIQVKRIYQSTAGSDGVRILVDRLWPRGISKETAKLDFWLKEVAPSTLLRQWFHSSGELNRFDQFKSHYLDELKVNPSVTELVAIIHKGEPVTLLYAVNDEDHNHALILREYITRLAG